MNIFNGPFFVSLITSRRCQNDSCSISDMHIRLSSTFELNFLLSDNFWGLWMFWICCLCGIKSFWKFSLHPINSYPHAVIPLMHYHRTWSADLGGLCPLSQIYYHRNEQSISYSLKWNIWNIFNVREQTMCKISKTNHLKNF